MNTIKKSIHATFQINPLQTFLGIALFFYVVYLGQEIILPFVFSIIIAILLNPFVNYLVRKRFNRILAIFIVLIIAIILMIVVISFLLSQMSLFGDTLPLWKD